VGRILLALALLVLVFGVILPGIIDYETIWTSLQSLAASDIAVLLVLTASRILTEALIYRAMLPGLRLWAGSQAYTSSSVVTMLPPPAPSVIQYAYFRAEGFDAKTATTGAAGTFVFPQAGRLALPLVAFAALVIVRRDDATAWTIAGAALVACCIAGVIIWLIGRSERSARWVGRQLARGLSWVLKWLHRGPVDDLGQRVVDFRDDAYLVVRRRWRFGAVAVAANLLVSFLLLLASLRFLGVDSSQIPTVVVFATFSAAFLAGTLIPLTAGGLGVVDIVLFVGLDAATSVNSDVIIAAVLVWRIFYDLVTIPIGACTLIAFSRSHADLLREARADLGGAASPRSGDGSDVAMR
jgi:uncharacterized membrane protein YbhN (UPF0104 family)